MPGAKGSPAERPPVLGSPSIIERQGDPVPDDDAPLFRQLSDERLFDPLPDEPAQPTPPPETVHDDHDVTPVDPDWFLSFDEVDSRLIRTLGAPE